MTSTQMGFEWFESANGVVNRPANGADIYLQSLFFDHLNPAGAISVLKFRWSAWTLTLSCIQF